MFIILCFSLFSLCKCETKNEETSHNTEDDPYYNYDNPYFDPDEYPYHDYNCTFPNTNKTEEGFCECIEGYTGDPYNPKGCFKCKYNCTENADCEYPGVCKCFYGYIGDGINSCELELPEIIDVTPKTSYPEGLVIISVSYKYSFGKPYQAYCRFGKSYVNHISITNDTIQCMAPPRSPGQYEFSISLDEQSWSKGKYMFEYINRPQPSRISIIPIILIYLGILVVISVVLYLIVGKKNNKFMGPTKEEKEPFLIDPEKPKKKKRAIKLKNGKL